MIPPLCATLGPVLAGPEGCSRGRWRSGPSKWRHTAAPEGRGQGAPRTCRCIETSWSSFAPTRKAAVREHHAPVGALRLSCSTPQRSDTQVREHHAPVGALRLSWRRPSVFLASCQGAPRTCRCIETLGPYYSKPVPTGQGAPRTCRCIETLGPYCSKPVPTGQGAPRTCRCIET